MSSQLERTIYSIVKDIVQEETLYLRHYLGQIVDNIDPSKKGKLKIIIPELGFDSPDLGLWCWPRQGHSMSIPKIKQYAEVYFLNGDRGWPVYLFPATEINGSAIKSYKGVIREHILFESPEDSKENIKYNAVDKSLSLLSGTKKSVLGDELLTWITNYITTYYNVHTHLDSLSSPTSVPVIPGVAPTDSDILSQVVKIK